MSEAAVHAVLVGLRRASKPPSLFAAYDADAAAEYALIPSLLPHGVSEDLAWIVRDAAFHLRWIELTETT